MVEGTKYGVNIKQGGASLSVSQSDRKALDSSLARLALISMKIRNMYKKTRLYYLLLVVVLLLWQCCGVSYREGAGLGLVGIILG